MTRIYLDNAATSWPKPESVYQAVNEYQRSGGASGGRSSYREAMAVDQKITAARKGIAQLIGCTDPRQIVFTFNGSDALNLAIHGLLQPGDHVVTTVMEHNSVLRPLSYLAENDNITITHVDCNAHGVINPNDVYSAIQENTKLVAVTHASNVTGAIQPVSEIGDLLADHPCKFLIDAAQTVGHLPLDVTLIQVDLLAAPGHKGLLGPLGTGFLYIKPGVENQLHTIRQGGTGTQSEEDRQPITLPEKYETGNHNSLGLMGLAAAIEYLQQQTIEKLRQHELELIDLLLQRLKQFPNLTLYGPIDPQQRVGVFSISIADYDPQEIATLLESGLDGDSRVQVRAGIHCAPLMHQVIGTIDIGGTVRLSIGPFTTPEEIETAVRAIGMLAASEI